MNFLQRQFAATV